MDSKASTLLLIGIVAVALAWMSYAAYVEESMTDEDRLTSMVGKGELKLRSFTNYTGSRSTLKVWLEGKTDRQLRYVITGLPQQAAGFIGGDTRDAIEFTWPGKRFSERQVTIEVFEPGEDTPVMKGRISVYLPRGF